MVRGEGEQSPMILGKLLATAEATSEAIREISSETKTNAKAIVQMSTTLDILGQTLSGLSSIVQGSTGDSIITRLKIAENTIDQLKTELAKNLAELGVVQDAQGVMRDKENQIKGGWAFLAWAVSILVGAIGIILAILGHFKG